MADFHSMQDSPENRIGFCHLAAFVVTLPFDRFYCQLVLISFILHTLIHTRKNSLRGIWSPDILILTSVFLVNIVGMIWSADKNEAFKDLQRQLVILLFPVILVLSDLDISRYKRKLLQFFGITCVIIILYLFADALRIISRNGMGLSSLFSSYFINHNSSEPLQIHATYLAMYVALSLSAFMIFFLEEKNRKKSLVYFAAVVVLVAGLIQLASRSVFIAIPFFTLASLFFLPAGKIKKYRLIMIAVAAGLMVLLLITRIESFQKRYITDFRNELTPAAVEPDNREPRIERWRCAFQLIRESPILGHGSGSEKRLLKERYYENKLFNSYLKELNAHNQYLSIWLKTGLFGLLLFLLSLAVGFLAAIKRRDPVFFSFLVLVVTVSFSENILDVNKGIFFYAFFFSFFWLAGQPLRSFQRLKRSNAPELKPVC